MLILRSIICVLMSWYELVVIHALRLDRLFEATMVDLLISYKFRTVLGCM